MNEATRRILTLCAIRIDGKSLDWNLIARAARDGQLDELWDGHVPARETTQARAAATALLHAGLRSLDEPRARVDAELDAGHRAGARLITVLDEDYPSNLRQVPDLPPSCSFSDNTTQLTSAPSPSSVPDKPPTPGYDEPAVWPPS